MSSFASPPFTCTCAGASACEWAPLDAWLHRAVLPALLPSEAQYSRRRRVMAWLSSVMEAVPACRGMSVEAFGSFASDLFHPSADLDLCLDLRLAGYMPHPQQQQGQQQGVSRRRQRVVLEAVRQKLKAEGARIIRILPSARVPLLSFIDPLPGAHLYCDLSVGNALGWFKSHVLRLLCRMDDRCRPLLFLVKAWARSKDLNDPKTGTLNSYSLCLLLVFHLQTVSPPILPAFHHFLPPSLSASILDHRAALHCLMPECEAAIQQCMSNRSVWQQQQQQQQQPPEDGSESQQLVHLPFILPPLPSSSASNCSTVAALFASFFSKFHAVSHLWQQGLVLRPFSAAWGSTADSDSEWHGRAYCMHVEDPFDRSDNCTRSVLKSKLPLICQAFATAAAALPMKKLPGMPQLPGTASLLFQPQAGRGSNSHKALAHNKPGNNSKGPGRAEQRPGVLKAPGKGGSSATNGPEQIGGGFKQQMNRNGGRWKGHAVVTVQMPGGTEKPASEGKASVGGSPEALSAPASDSVTGGRATSEGRQREEGGGTAWSAGTGSSSVAPGGRKAGKTTGKEARPSGEEMEGRAGASEHERGGGGGEVSGTCSDASGMKAHAVDKTHPEKVGGQGLRVNHTESINRAGESRKEGTLQQRIEEGEGIEHVPMSPCGDTTPLGDNKEGSVAQRLMALNIDSVEEQCGVISKDVQHHSLRGRGWSRGRGRRWGRDRERGWGRVTTTGGRGLLTGISTGAAPLSLKHRELVGPGLSGPPA